MDSNEDLSARFLLKNVLNTELPRTPVTRSGAKAQTSSIQTRRSDRLIRKDAGAQTPQEVLRRSLKHKLRESTSRISLPASKRRTISAVVRKSNTPAPATASLLYDDGVTPRHLLRNILRTEPEVSILVQEKALSKEPQLPSTNSSLNSNRPSTGLSGLDLPDLTIASTASTVKGLTRKRPRRSLNITAFEKLLKHGDDVEKQGEESADDLSSLSSNLSRSVTLSLKTPFVDARTEKRGLQRKVPNRQKISVEEFGARLHRQMGADPAVSIGVVERALGETAHSEGFTLGLSDLIEPDITTDIINHNTALYAQPDATESTFSIVATQDKPTVMGSQLQREMDDVEDEAEAEVEHRQLVAGFTSVGHAEVDSSLTKFQSEEEESGAESQTDEEVAAAKTQTEEVESVAESQTDEEDAAAKTQSEEVESVAESQTDEEVAAAKTQSEEVESVAESQTDEEDAAAKTQSEEVESVTESQTDEEDAAAKTQSEEEESVAESQTDEEDTAAKSESKEEQDVPEFQFSTSLSDSHIEDGDDGKERAEDIEGATQLPHDAEHINRRIHRSEGGLIMPVVEDEGNGAVPRATEDGWSDAKSKGHSTGDWHSGQDMGSSSIAEAGPGIENNSLCRLELTDDMENSSHHSGTVASEQVAAQGPADQEEEGGDDDDDDEEDGEPSEELSMKTPAFVREKRNFFPPDPLASPTVLKNIQASVENEASAATKPKKVRVRRTGPTKNEPGLPKSYLMGVFRHFAKTKVSPDVYPVLKDIMDKFFDRLAEDLEAYAIHAKRKTIEVEDVELLLKRQGYVTDKVPVEVLIEKYLPMEYRKLLIPIATSGNVVIPKQRR